jgi:hypothetical protein
MTRAQESFPQCGKNFSTVWKKWPFFSTQWKKFSRFFHTMEKMFPHCGKLACGALLAGGLAAGAGCQSVKTGRFLAVPKVVHWTATASASEEGHGPEQALDGQTNTWWRSGNGEPQWIQVDMARAAMVCGFSLQWSAPHATSYSVLTSRDGIHWALGYETTAGDGDWDQVSIEPTLARYLRVLVTRGLQGNGAALCALEIKGLADQPRIWVDGIATPGAAAILDGNPATTWRAARPEAVVELDLRTEKPVGSVRVDWGAHGFASNVMVAVSTNRADWMPAGHMQAHRSGDFDVAMSNEVRPARYVRLSFSGGSATEGFEVAGLTLRGAEGAARPWAMYELAAAHAPEGVYPDAFWNQQTYWVVAGGPQPGDPESLLDEWGVFAPRAQGPTLAPLIVSGGQVESARQAAGLEHRLGGDGAPMPETVWKMSTGLSLRIRALARSGVAPATAWVQYELANDSIMAQTGRLCWVVRPVRLPPPWAGGGLAPIYKIRHLTAANGWQEIWANEEPLFAVPEAAHAFGAAPFANGDVTEFFLRGETPAAKFARDENGMASAAWWTDFALEPGQRMRMVVAGNAQETAGPSVRRFPWPDAKGTEKAADAFDREWVDASWAWRAETGHYAPKIARPDAVDCLQAQVGWLLAVRGSSEGEDLDSIQARVAALLRAGQPAAARKWIERVAAGVQTNGWVPAVFRPDGAPEPRLGQEGRHASQGQFAFMVMEYYRFTRDAAFLHDQYPAMRQALAYLEGLRTELEKTEWRLPPDERYLLEGLLPLSGARPGSPRPVHLYADHYWALLGWKEGRTAAALLGLDSDAAWADENYRLLKSSVRRSLRAQLDKRDSSWLPAAAEEDRFDANSVALLFWPCEETDLVDPHELQSSLDLFYEEFLLRRQPGWAGRISSDEALLLVPLARAGRGDYAREVLYALLDRRQPPGWHVWADAAANDPRRPRQIGYMPDVHVAASYFIGVRDLAARETGQRLDLFSGAPAEWLQHGDGFRVLGMPTAFGPLDLTGYWHRNRLVVEIGGGVHPPEGYRIWWPRQIAPDQLLANGMHLKTFDAMGVDLPHDFKGTIEASFPYMAPWPRDP